MSEIKLICPTVPNMPWQEKPSGCTAPMWRHSDNPIIGRNPLPDVSRIFNSAVMPFGDGFVGVFRGEQRDGIPHVYFGRSKDAMHWEFDPEKIDFRDYGAAIGMAETKDFTSFTRLENPFLPYNRNAVLFPRKINGNFVMLSRPCDNGHTAFGDIFVSESPDMVYWGRHRHVMGRGERWWENLKIGGGAAPIETDKGWLMFYHGVVNTCNGYVYSVGAAILDIDEPSRVLHRCGNYILTPEEWYEERGFVPNVCFPCATIHDSETGRIALYYGCADSYVGVSYTTAQEIYDYILAHDVASEDDKGLGRR